MDKLIHSPCYDLTVGGITRSLRKRHYLVRTCKIGGNSFRVGRTPDIADKALAEAKFVVTRGLIRETSREMTNFSNDKVDDAAGRQCDDHVGKCVIVKGICYRTGF